MISQLEPGLKLLRETQTGHKLNRFRPQVDMICPFSLKIGYFSILSRSKLFAKLTHKLTCLLNVSARTDPLSNSPWKYRYLKENNKTKKMLEGEGAEFFLMIFNRWLH